jgi:hypothetical protein
MSEDAERPDEIERLARPLRAPERVDATFKERVMSAVHADQRAIAPWRRPFTMRVTPFMALAAAAAFAAIVLAAEAGARHMAGVASVSPKADTVVIVRFVLADPSARSVSLVGSFNQWRKDATPLRASGAPGTWVVSVPLAQGRHEYAFVVSDGSRERWIADPSLPVELDQHGTQSSILTLRSLD